MRISVITPTKDRPEAVELCRRWFKEQTYPVHEHLVIEGGGHLDNIRAGLTQVSGDVILLADDDDYYAPGWTQWLADVYANPDVHAAGHPTKAMYHPRTERRLECNIGPLAGSLSFRTEDSELVAQCIEFDKRPKRILRNVHSVIAQETFCYRIMGLYHGGRPGRGLSRKHNPELFNISDPGLTELRALIGDPVVDAYLKAIEHIDARLAA